MEPGNGVSADKVLRRPGTEWDQGDIVDGVYFPGVDAKLPAVLVTPACDLAHDKVELWTFVALFPDTEVGRAVAEGEIQGWNVRRDAAGVLAPSPKQKTSLEKVLGSLLGQRYPRYHWVPVPIGAAAGHVADFTNVTSLPCQEVREKATRVASLASSWREQLPTRYAAFMGRVGTDDLAGAVLREHIARLLAAVLAPPSG